MLAATAAALVPLAGTATAAPAPTAAAAAPRTLLPDDAAAGWLARRLVDGNHLETTFGDTSFPDQGLTVDGVFAFAAAKVAGSAAAAATAWLALPENLDSYTGGGGTESYAGPTAKLMLLAEVRGANPRSFGGVNLRARLLDLLTPSGRFSDRSAFGDFSNAFGQSYALLALKRDGGVPAAAVAFLAGRQCADGGFPVELDTTACTGDTDATALVAQALRATGRTAAANRAIAWLASKQQPGGGVAALDGSGTPNANSTGVTGQALADAGRVVPAVRAGLFLARLQVRCSGAAADRGAVPFDRSGIDPATAPRATAQAVLGLTGVGLVRLAAAGSAPGAPVLAC
ncbi:MAG TPA: prenyltransferase/squalene oxidase repeat-containing protein [Mycobacteriales bacterium]|nr:prenyltransferase/squalene oxidase repeat-containing protein [Mycobacteriales bacterium]